MEIVMRLAETLMRMLDESGATEMEKLAAVNIVKLLVPLSRKSLHENSTSLREQHEQFGPTDSECS